MNDWTDRASLEKTATWKAEEETIDCYLKDGSTKKPVKILYETSDTGIIELKSVTPLGEPRENFDSLITDIGEHFGRGSSKSDYSEYRGLFNNELQ